MRKRNHVIPIRLNTKEMKHLETQVAVSGLNREVKCYNKVVTEVANKI